jgi:dTDP-4-amino-4,6-dideoxygalactose transaminase
MAFLDSLRRRLLPSRRRAQARRTLGGDFELTSLARGDSSELDSLTRGRRGTWTASGRSAQGLVLSHLREQGVRHVHLPAYLCDTMIQPVSALGMELSLYPVDGSLVAHPEPPRGSAVVLVHFFGWLSEATASLRAETGGAFHLIEDFSHALLSDWGESMGPIPHLFFSAHKLCAVPPCGWSSTMEEAREPTEDAQALSERALSMLLLRGAYMADPDASPIEEIEAFYWKTQKANEARLDAMPLDWAVPTLTLDLLAAWDRERAKSQRRANWQRLDETLAARVERLSPPLRDGVTPLGYAVRLPHRERVERRLVEHRIRGMPLWPLPAEVSADRFPEAARLSRECLVLPIDERYDSDDMERLAQGLLASL